jgi:hypothetical protein
MEGSAVPRAATQPLHGTHARAQTCTRMRIHMHTHAHTHAHACACTLAPTHPPTHPHTHAGLYRGPPACNALRFLRELLGSIRKSVLWALSVLLLFVVLSFPEGLAPAKEAKQDASCMPKPCLARPHDQMFLCRRFYGVFSAIPVCPIGATRPCHAMCWGRMHLLPLGTVTTVPVSKPNFSTVRSASWPWRTAWSTWGPAFTPTNRGTCLHI